MSILCSAATSDQLQFDGHTVDAAGGDEDFGRGAVQRLDKKLAAMASTSAASAACFLEALASRMQYAFRVCAVGVVSSRATNHPPPTKTFSNFIFRLYLLFDVSEKPTHARSYKHSECAVFSTVVYARTAMTPHHYRLLLLLTAAPAVLAGVDHLTVGTHDFILEGGASFVSGHGAPTGIALRSGDPGQTTGASFPQLVLAPGATITSVALTYRYTSGYGRPASDMAQICPFMSATSR